MRLPPRLADSPAPGYIADQSPEYQVAAASESHNTPQTGNVWFYTSDGQALLPESRSLHNISYNEYATMPLRPNQIARYDTADVNPHTEYHDEWVGDTNRTVLYRRGAERPQPWPAGLPYAGCQCSQCGSDDPPATVLPEPPADA